MLEKNKFDWDNYCDSVEVIFTNSSSGFTSILPKSEEIVRLLGPYVNHSWYKFKLEIYFTSMKFKIASTDIRSIFAASIITTNHLVGIPKHIVEKLSPLCMALVLEKDIPNDVSGHNSNISGRISRTVQDI